MVGDDHGTGSSERPGLSAKRRTNRETVRVAALGVGRVVAGRYRIEGMLGRGGMGEVWKAYDQKLCLDVALKRLHPDLLSDSRRVELLRREVRAAREVASPHVCRVFDLVEVDNEELLSMEFVDGASLNDILNRRGPLDLAEAGEIAGQLLAGLEAIHAAGLIHRDLKPANVMVTRAGRVVVMDFGIARAMPEVGETATGPGTIAGTPAYMPPEQARGDDLDARADLFSAGVVLAEMLAVRADEPQSTREQLWTGIRAMPPRMPSGPWAPAIAKAVSADRESRPGSARELARTLRDVTDRAEGREEVTPYPGLSFFTESDARFFFGRELEVENTWKKLSRAPMLAVVGPSGVGKSSFLRAGLLPALPDVWRAIVCTPGTAPMVSLARALTPELAGDTEAMLELVRFEQNDVAVSMFRRWRSGGGERLVIIDQGEELFTLNPPEVQSRFAELLGRLTVEADVRLIYSLRDDFFFHCHQHPAMTPLFSNCMPLSPLQGEDLRRALVQPALACGYRFEDDALADEMIAPIAGERGALPLLAFAASRLWEKRDRKRGRLTRQAFEDIGKVGGALAQHAERTLESIGHVHFDVVREIFRNLVTAQGTRVARDRHQLLSVFEDDATAGKVLQQLIDARLLTSFETAPESGENEGRHQRIEIVHESLLASWPRLVRWQTQDADGAQLRDQLRQAAQLWDQRSRSDDLLWTGTAYREFELWRERYPGGLSESEQGFAEAMQARDRRGRRRRRALSWSAFALLTVVLAVVGGLWRSAAEQATRAEASRLLAEGRTYLEENNAISLAHAIASLERLDTPDGRRFALEALWKGPTESPVLEYRGYWAVDFSADGHWLAELNDGVFIRSADGETPKSLEWDASELRKVTFHKQRPLLLAVSQDPSDCVRVWSVPGGELVLAPELEGRSDAFWTANPNVLLTATLSGSGPTLLWRSWSLDGGAATVLGSTPSESDDYLELWRGRVDPSGSRFLTLRQNTIRMTELDRLEDNPDGEILAELDAPVVRAVFDGSGDRVASVDAAGRVQLWEVANGETPRVRMIGEHPGAWVLRFGPGDTTLMTATADDGTVCLWDLTGPPQADPVVVRLPGNQVNDVAVHPSGGWLVQAGAGDQRFWPLTHAYPKTLRGHSGYVANLEFEPTGRWLLSNSFDGTVRLWGLSPAAEDLTRIHRGGGYSAAMDAEGERYVVGAVMHCSLRARENGAVIRDLGSEAVFDSISDVVHSVALSSDARFAAATGGWDQPGAIGVWDLQSDRFWTVDAGDSVAVGIAFIDERRLLTRSETGLRLWDVEARRYELLRRAPILDADASADGRRILSVERSGAFVTDWATGEVFALAEHQGQSCGAIDPTGEWVATGNGKTGEIRFGAARGGEAHLLMKHPRLGSLAFDPAGRWLASGGMDGTIRLWPIPTGKPFHTLPHGEFLERLRALTTLRVVSDGQGAYEIERERFSGWAEAPTW